MLTEHLYRCKDFSRLLRLFCSFTSRVVRKLSCDPDQDKPTAGGSVAGSYVDAEHRNLPMCGFILFLLHKSGRSSAISQNQEGVLEPQEWFSLFTTKIERNCSHFLQTLLATKQLTGGKNVPALQNATRRGLKSEARTARTRRVLFLNHVPLLMRTCNASLALQRLHICWDIYSSSGGFSPQGGAEQTRNV